MVEKKADDNLDGAGDGRGIRESTPENLEDIGKTDVQGLTGWICFHLRACNINRVFSSCFYATVSNLEDLHVEYCYSLKEVFYLEEIEEERSGLTRLRELILEEIVSNDNAEVGGEAVQQMDLFTVPPLFFFQNLQKLLISKCNKMESVLPLTVVEGLNLLEELTVDSFNQVERIVTTSGEVRESKCKNMLMSRRY
ncbi:hypothetical protein QYF36_014563 [Acer negundo]|nr:hypothetical protein QYF36_014563 [Acer negundo]